MRCINDSTLVQQGLWCGGKVLGSYSSSLYGGGQTKVRNRNNIAPGSTKQTPVPVYFSHRKSWPPPRHCHLLHPHASTASTRCPERFWGSSKGSIIGRLSPGCLTTPATIGPCPSGHSSASTSFNTALESACLALVARLAKPLSRPPSHSATVDDVSASRLYPAHSSWAAELASGS